MKTILATTLVLTLFAQGGPHSPAAGQTGSDAVAKDDPRIEGWAQAVESYSPDGSVAQAWRNSSLTLGPAEGNVFEVCSLGPGGTLTLSFGRTISNRLGPELAVFENGFSDSFLEFAFVEVSSDGVHFVRFPNESLTPDPVGSFGIIDTTEVAGLAGKYRQGFGTPFDFSALPEDPLLDLNAVRFVRLVDVVGGQSRDSSDAVIYDPFPTSVSAGFDCDAVALLVPGEVLISSTSVSESEFILRWQSEVGKNYAVEASETLQSDDWAELATWEAEEDELQFSFLTSGASKQFFRVVEE